MKKIYQRNGNFTTVGDVVTHNTSTEILQEELREYSIDFKDIKEIILPYKGKISLISDYDVDGVCSSLIMDLLFVYLGKDFEVYVPRRMSDGYGLSEGILDKVTGDLIVTIDNGIAAIPAIKKAKEMGKTVIIIDHHLPYKENGMTIYPDADCILDLEADCGTGDFKHYCGAGLAYKLLCDIVSNKIIREQALLYAAIATISDMVPLRFDNRKIVKEGLELFHKSKDIPGPLKYLLYKSYLYEVTEKDIGFRIGPVINAPGRLYDNGGQYVYETMKCTHKSDYVSRIELLLRVNEERKQKTKEAVENAEQIIKENHMEDDNPLIVYLLGIPEGIVGLVAGKLNEKYQAVTIILSDSVTPGILKGSGRTYGSANLKEVLDHSSEYLLKYGGHSAAAGVSLSAKNLDRFRKKMQTLFHGKEDIPLTYDIVVKDNELLSKHLQDLKVYGPFGVGNPEPVFLIERFEMMPGYKGFYEMFGPDQEHVKMFGPNEEAIGFFIGNEFRKAGFPTCVYIYGTLSEKVTQYGRKLQIEVRDFKPIPVVKNITSLAEELKLMAENRKWGCRTKF